MTVKALIARLEALPDHSQIYLSGDEELNTIYGEIDIVTFEIEKSNGHGTYDAFSLYPIKGSEVDE